MRVIQIYRLRLRRKRLLLRSKAKRRQLQVVVDRTAGLRPEPDLVPDRFLVRAWPDKATLDHLRAEAVSL